MLKVLYLYLQDWFNFKNLVRVANVTLTLNCLFMKINATDYNESWVLSFKNAEDFAENCNLPHLNLTEKQLQDVYTRIQGPGAENKPTGGGKGSGKDKPGRNTEPSSGAVIEGPNK